LAFTYVTVTHDFDLPDGVGALGTVEFTPVHQMTNGGETKSGTIRRTLAAGGGLSQVLAATTDPDTDPIGVTYKIDVRLTGQPARTYFTQLPHDRGNTIGLAALLEWAAAGGLGQASPVLLIADADGLITPDLGDGSLFRYYADEDVTLGDPAAGGDGQRIDVQIYAHDANRTLTTAGGTTVIPVGTWWWGRLSYSELHDQWILEDGFGTVTSVNGQVNNVMLTADNIPDGSAKVLMTSAERGKLDGVAPGATVYSDEHVDDRVNALFVMGANMTKTYDDVANTYTLSAATSGASGIPAATVDAKGDLIVGTANDTVARFAVGATTGHVLTVNPGTSSGLEWAAAGAGSTDPEVVRDTIATALINGLGTRPVVNDAGDTIAIDSTARVVRTVAPSAGAIAINANTVGDSVDSTLTGDATLDVPTNGAAGQVIQGTCHASGAQRVLTFNASYGRLTGIAATLTIPSGKLGRYSIRRTDLTGSAKWLVEAAGVEQ
jgi:hypothetical protein